MWPDRRLCDLLGIEHPIIQAPMADGPATPALAIAVSEAGGLGSLACAEIPLDQVRAVTAEMRAGTNRPFNLNFFVYPAPVADAAILAAARQRLKPWFDELGLGEPAAEIPGSSAGFTKPKLDLLLELRPPVVSFHFGLPDDEALAALKAVGIVLLCTATTVAEARVLEARGVDAIIAQGWEAGGHRGSHRPTAPGQGIGTMALVPQVVDAVRLPVIAAGGIGDGRGIAAAQALGACGVQMGTAFLSCDEAGTDAARRVLLRSASDTDTMVTDAISGRSARTFRSRYAEDMERNRQHLPDFPSLYVLTDPLTGTGQTEVANFHLYGQAAALNVECPAAERMARLVSETQETMRRMRIR